MLKAWLQTEKGRIEEARTLKALCRMLGKLKTLTPTQAQEVEAAKTSVNRYNENPNADNQRAAVEALKAVLSGLGVASGNGRPRDEKGRFIKMR